MDKSKLVVLPGGGRKTEAEQLLVDFAEWCLIRSDIEQQVGFTKLRESIFKYLDNKKSKQSRN